MQFILYYALLVITFITFGSLIEEYKVTKTIKFNSWKIRFNNWIFRIFKQ